MVFNHWWFDSLVEKAAESKNLIEKPGDFGQSQFFGA
jgi:hypothetical protein